MFVILRIRRGMVKNVHWSPCKVPLIFVGFLMKLRFSQHIFEKYPNIKFNENPSTGSRVVPCGRRDGQTYLTKLRSPFAILRKRLN